MYPDLSYRSIDVTLEYINRCLGLQLGAAEVSKLLAKMQIEPAAEGPAAAASGDKLSLKAPPTRSDVLHACDIMEDVAIAYGYNNLTKHVSTILGQDVLRSTVWLMCGCGSAFHRWELCGILLMSSLVQIPATVTQGKELPLNQLTEMLRQECAMAGYTEILTW